MVGGGGERHEHFRSLYREKIGDIQSGLITLRDATSASNAPSARADTIARSRGSFPSAWSAGDDTIF